MNTAKLKAYAPKARRDFIAAVTKQAQKYGVTADQIHPVEITGDVAVVNGKPFPVKLADKIKKLGERVNTTGFEQTMEQVAYSWFNRLMAIRYMELHSYLDHGRRVLSHPDHDTGFQILDECTDITYGQGGQLPDLSHEKVVELKLDGTKDEELYRALLLSQCHALNKSMPFLFESVDDESELLLPENLTKTDSLIRGLVNDIPEEDWDNVEVVGWLYQFYISEKKDQVIGKVVKSEDIPAATQLFTPNWIVKYLVQNSVGRQWLQTYPESTIKAEMEYYIEPAEQTAEVQAQLDAITPAEIDPLCIKVLDPACGSGHILVEAYKVLKTIYEERGFRSRDIPQLILENNIFGLDIDDRAAQLSGFALMMLAREDDRRIFDRDVKLNILSIQETQNLDLQSNWQDGEFEPLLDSTLGDEKGQESYELLQQLWQDFELGKTFGSLISVDNEHEAQLKALLEKLEEIAENGEFLQRPAAKALIPIVKQAWVLSLRYDSVVANPPFMSGKGMNFELKELGRKKYPDSKSDLYSVCIDRYKKFSNGGSYFGFVSPYTWMFISSFEKFRRNIFNHGSIDSLIKPSYTSFFDSAIVPLVAFLVRDGVEGLSGKYTDLGYLGRAEEQPGRLKSAIAGSSTYPIFKKSFDDFNKIPGAPVAYWVSKDMLQLFDTKKRLSEQGVMPATGLQTGDNTRFIRYWYEIESSSNKNKWIPLNDGGDVRRWYGNFLSVINWENNGEAIRRNKSSVIRNPDFYLKEGATWNRISSSFFAIRYLPEGFVFDQAGDSLFCNDANDLPLMIAFLNSKVGFSLMKILCPTLNATAGSLDKFPKPNISLDILGRVKSICRELIKIHKKDWDSQELSMEFLENNLVQFSKKFKTIETSLKKYNDLSIGIVERAKSLEEINNKIFIDEAKLSNEICHTVSKNELTLFCNPDCKLEDAGTDAVVKSDMVSELVSYSVGVMLGRFSLDQKGLAYAKSGNKGFDDLVEQGAYKTFPADDDGIIPLTKQEWFPDDATNRFSEFVETVWGAETLQENLDFVAESLCLHAIKPKNGEDALATIRRYLSTQFYKDHLKTYKKRPIYWLFSSGRNKAFECLVYLHRYNESTLARMRTEYVIPLTAKLNSHIEKLENDKGASGSAAEVKKLEKEIKNLQKQQTELTEFDETLKHYADMRISLDLDDGVKVNYGKFGDLLADVKAIHGKKV